MVCKSLSLSNCCVARKSRQHFLTHFSRRHFRHSVYIQLARALSLNAAAECVRCLCVSECVCVCLYKRVCVCVLAFEVQSPAERVDTCFMRHTYTKRRQTHTCDTHSGNKHTLSLDTHTDNTHTVIATPPNAKELPRCRTYINEWN